MPAIKSCIENVGDGKLDFPLDERIVAESNGPQLTPLGYSQF